MIPVKLPTLKADLIALADQVGVASTGSITELKARLEAKRGPGTGVTPAAGQGVPPSITDRVKEVQAMVTGGLITAEQGAAAVAVILGTQQTHTAHVNAPPPPQTVSTEDSVITNTSRLNAQIRDWFGKKGAPFFNGIAYAALTGDAESERCRDRLKNLLTNDDLNRRLAKEFSSVAEGVTPAFLVGTTAAHEVARLSAWLFVTSFCEILAEEVSVPEQSALQREAFRNTIKDMMGASAAAAARQVFISTVHKLQAAEDASSKQPPAKKNRVEDKDDGEKKCSFCVSRGYSGMGHLVGVCNRKKNADKQQAHAAQQVTPIFPAPDVYCKKCNKRHKGPAC